MLGSRTKQINSYGKRGTRVINTSEEPNQPTTNSEIISIFDDLPPPPEWKSVASRMKKRENVVPHKSTMTSVKVVGLQRKKRLSPVLSPIKKKQTTRVDPLNGSDAPRKRKEAASKPLATGKVADPIILSASPVRAPLSAVMLNIPGSPGGRKGYKPTKLKKSSSPLIDVDIIVLDEEGHTLKTEKRVSRTNVIANPFQYTSGPPMKEITTVDDSDTEADVAEQPRRATRKVAHRAAILSDSSDSEPKSVRGKTSCHSVEKSSELRSPAVPQSSMRPKVRSQLEVLVPPLPYKISKNPRPSEDLAQPSQPSTGRYIHPSEQARPQPSKARYQHHDSPMQKSRQLTPIRGDRRRLFNIPSPTTPTDIDLSIDFSDLSIGSPIQNGYQADFDIPDSLIPLLEECHQETCGPHNFSTFIESFPYDPILQSARRNEGIDMEFRKIGEASYSEVFGIGDVVLKVIPLRDESNTRQEYEESDGPAPSDAKDVRKEIIVTRAMGEVHNCFVKLLKTYVVRGRYPEVLLKLWDDYNERKGSESIRPDSFKVSQTYAIIVLPNGGPDLEAYTFTNSSKTGWRQACSLFWQVAKALAHAEHLVSFEHRDLHWGQVLVKNLPKHALKPLNLNQSARSHRLFMDDLDHGVQATVIDLGLSRMDAGDGGSGDDVHWTPFDEEVFMGEGDYQFDVYRMMKELVGGDWEGFHPITNILWLHYLLQKIICSKGIKPPATPRKPKAIPEAPLPKLAHATFSEKDCYDCLIDIDNWLGQTISDMIPGANRASKTKGRRKGQLPTKTDGPISAGEVVAYGAKKGWIQGTTLF